MNKFKNFKKAAIGAGVLAAFSIQNAMAAITVDTTDLISDIESMRTPIIAVGLAMVGIVFVSKALRQLGRAG